jgi:cytochrome c oxidase subunit 2
MPLVLDPNSPDAAAIAALTWVLVVGAAVVFVATMATVALAFRAPPAWLARERTIVVAGIAVPAAIVIALLAYGVRIATAADTLPPDVRIELIGHQWWWQVRYLHADGTPDFETANEIRVPVGRRVDIALASADVLHSFWVPQLGGKLDLVPGRVNRVRVSAQRPGVARGQCAEYCGGPHAQMGLVVVASADDEFERWRTAQRAPAASAHALFASRCGVCHAIRGTSAAGMRGPDLTHVASRLAIGAGSLANNPGTLAAWIAASQHIKPGNLMPSFATFDGAQLRDLAGYLAGLQ